MLKKRIIPCLDIKDGRTVKGVNFVQIKDAGDPVELAKKYVEQNADELVFLDIMATLENRSTLVELVKKIAKEINIPFTVGGGIKTKEDAKTIIEAGADKISINSSAVKNPSLIKSIAGEFGCQCVTVAIDTKIVDGEWMVCIGAGTILSDLKAVDWAVEAEKLGAGEILLTSMEHDGTKNGFSIDILEKISSAVNIPVIASGGAGKMEHFKEVFMKTKVGAALAASIFHYGEISVVELKKYLSGNGVPVRLV